MILEHVRVQNFRSIVDSGKVDISEITCLVGKNESGKTSFLTALELINPGIGDRKLDIVDDFPRWNLGEGEAAMEADNPPKVVTAWYSLTEEERQELADRFGVGVVTTDDPQVALHYSGRRTWTFSTNEAAAVEKLREVLGSPSALDELTTIQSLRAAVAGTDFEGELEAAGYGWDDLLQMRREVMSWMEAHEPAFLYFGEYSLMPGRVSVQALISRRDNDQLDEEDRTFLALLDIANTPLESFQDDAGYERQKSRLEAAGLSLTNEIFNYWKQNEGSSIEFDKSAADVNAEGDLASGINLHVRAKGHRGVSVAIDRGSHGFRWFFSFLVYFTKVRDLVGNRPLVILLDEPGGALHALAQQDFLEMLEERLAPISQVAYSTHSPFMVDANHLERVRLVTDDVDKGTVVSNEVLRIDSDTLFPLQAALGYSIGQTLFVAPNALMVEGSSDLLYLQNLSRALEDQGRTGIDPRWVLVPVGGASKVETFVRLYGANQLHTAVLLDGSTKLEQQKAQLTATGQIEERQIVAISDVLDGQAEADIEDLFPTEFYVHLVSGAYPRSQAAALTAEAVDEQGNPRLVKRVEQVLADYGMTNFSHLPPALELVSGTGAPYALPPESLDRAEKLFALLNAALEDPTKAVKPSARKRPKSRATTKKKT